MISALLRAPTYRSRSNDKARPIAPSLSRATRARCRGFQSGRNRVSRSSISPAAIAPRLNVMQRERIVGSSSPAFSVSRKMLANSGGSSSTLSSEFAASFINAELLKI